MATTLRIALSVACLLTFARAGVRARTPRSKPGASRPHLPTVSSLKSQAGPAAAGTAGGHLFVCLLFLLIPAASWAVPVFEYHRATPAVGPRLELYNPHALTDTAGFALRMDANLPTFRKRGSASLALAGAQPAVGNAWQAWLVAVALLAAGASLAWRWRGQHKVVEVCSPAAANTPSYEENDQAWQLKSQPENATVGSPIPTVPPAPVALAAQPAPVLPAAESVVPRPARMSIVERAANRANPVFQKSDSRI